MMEFDSRIVFVCVVGILILLVVTVFVVFGTDKGCEDWDTVKIGKTTTQVCDDD